MTTLSQTASSTVLIWEDSVDEQTQWWLSRVQHLGHELVIAFDEFSSSIVLMERPGGTQSLKVISAFPGEDKASGIDAAKAAALAWLSEEQHQELAWQKLRWQLRRGLRMWVYDLPLLLTSAMFGVVLGWFVGVFFDTINQRSLWTIAFGLALGAGLGPVLSHLVKSGLGSKRSVRYRSVAAMLSAGGFAATTVAVMVVPNA